jgi:queuine tRNA-ribosyltransferase
MVLITFFTGKCKIQRSIGADIIMAFDECTLILVTIIMQRSMKMTHRWLDRWLII